MLRANVGLSKKLSQDFNSHGFSINIEGEITARIDDPEAVLDQVAKLWETAEESLRLEIEKYQPTQTSGRPNNARQKPAPAATERASGSQQQTLATEKQVNYLLRLARRKGLNTVQLEDQISDLLGKDIGLNQLSKHQAAKAIDSLQQTVNVA